MEHKKVEIIATVVQKTGIPGDPTGHVFGVDASMTRRYYHTRYILRSLDNKFYAWDAYKKHDLFVHGVYKFFGSIKKKNTELTELTRCKINTHLIQGE